MKKTECTCSKCITLPVCKSLIKNGDFFDLLALSDRCDTFKRYIYLDSTVYNYNKKQSELTDKCLIELKESLISKLGFKQKLVLFYDDPNY